MGTKPGSPPTEPGSGKNIVSLGFWFGAINIEQLVHFGFKDQSMISALPFSNLRCIKVRASLPISPITIGACTLQFSG